MGTSYWPGTWKEQQLAQALASDKGWCRAEQFPLGSQRVGALAGATSNLPAR